MLFAGVRNALTHRTLPQDTRSANRTKHHAKDRICALVLIQGKMSEWMSVVAITC